ncbi:pentatricopeptide repeat-containing protein, putative [Ricinus communis]|uniref:Large ribosomal subunit protein mL45 n=1 Tax=Ricinus communis TaxID=3988 RepID=B9RF13_RICCO|nr:pentatricopeptide repeat-containing protein, putative [Ricinus communis]|eukprot:XP_002512332.1 pentatricopeptide repeat-containing protein At3g56030, mitochondrial isoform X1 [Ricinus communis]
MALLRRLQAIRALSRTAESRNPSCLLQSSRSYYSDFSNGLEFNSQRIFLSPYKGHNAFPWTHGSTMTHQSSTPIELSTFVNDKRLLTTQARAPPQARQMGALKVSVSSPGFIYEPYAPREPIPFWRRWFTKSGWRRTKEDIILELKSAYAVSKLRKSGYSKHQLYKEAIELYKEISTMIANGDKNSLRKAVTEKMYSELKNEIKQRESMWSKVYWELVEPVIKIRTLRARLIGVDRSDFSKVFIQLTLELLTKQKFEAYDSKDTVVAGDKTKELAHSTYLNSETTVLPFFRKLHHMPLNSQSILSLTTRCFTTQNDKLNSFPDKPTAAYYDGLVNAAGHERDFKTLHHLLNKRVRDHCFNTTNTFKFITNTDNSLSVLDDLIQTLARLDKGIPRMSAYNMLIARLCKLDRIQESLHIVHIMADEQYGLSTCSFHPILSSLTQKKKMEDSWKVIEMMRAIGVLPDLTAFNYLLTAYCYNGNLVDACKVMKRIEEEGLGADARTYDALVLGACRTGKVEAALVVLRRMVDDGVHVLYSTHVHVINALLRLGCYVQATKFVMIFGGRDIAFDTEIFGILASKLIKLERFEEAKLVLKEMEERGLVMGDKLRDYCYVNVKIVE